MRTGILYAIMISWTQNPIMKTGNMDENYRVVTDGLDALLARYGYVRDGYRYHASDETNRREAVIVCFCHLGVTCVALSHLLNTTPVQLWQGPVPALNFRHDRRNGRAQTRRSVLPLPTRPSAMSITCFLRANRFRIMERLTIHSNFNIRRQEVPRF